MIRGALRWMSLALGLFLAACNASQPAPQPRAQATDAINAFEALQAGDYQRAAELYRRALAIQVEVLGPDHPDLARTLDNYAALLREQRRDREAHRLETRARDIRTRHAWDQPSR